MQKEKGIDRAKDTAMAFGVIKELQSTTDMLLSKGDYISMRTRMDLMLEQAMMLRGEDGRKAELSELFIIDALNEGSKGDVQLLCLRLMSGKVCYTFPPSVLVVYSVLILCRPIKRVSHNMVSLFVTRM
jgi:hypothetical protein